MHNYSISYSSTPDASSLETFLGILAAYSVICIIIAVITVIGQWKVYKKAGRPGWACLIPIYNVYTLFDIVYGNGWKFLLCLIPFYNIYLVIRLDIDLAHVFGKSTVFAVGLIFFSTIFLCILGFGSAEYKGYISERTVYVCRTGAGKQDDHNDDLEVL